MAFLFLPAKSFANPLLPAIFSDHMVLQQKEEAKFWGWADPGETITITTGWKARATAKADAAGRWMVTVKTPAAGGPYLINIKGKSQLDIKDVMIGEVWVCSGQSNMVFSLKSSEGAEAEITKADFPSIRYFSVERQYGPQPFQDAPGSIWKQTSPATAPGYSAVAYYFAKKIHQTLHVPVGIVYTAWGGTPAEAWTPGTTIKDDRLLSLYLDRWKHIQDNVGKDSVAYNKAVEEWEKKKSTVDSIKIKKPDEPRTFYYYKRPWREPSVLFNGMVSPVIPYSIKGVLWYQGESNVGYADEYEYLFSKMIESWRMSWSKPALPFYFVQIAPYGYNNLDAAARLRLGQYNITKKITGTGIAVTVDLGNMKDIHFTRKREVGERLAFLALAKNYGLDKTVYLGPECIDVERKDNKLAIKFSQALSTYDHKESQGFEIGYRRPGSDSIYYKPASSIIRGKEVTAWNEEIEHPVAIRYAWLLIGDANLVNEAGLPAPPFKKEL